MVISVNLQTQSGKKIIIACVPRPMEGNRVTPIFSYLTEQTVPPQAAGHNNYIYYISLCALRLLLHLKDAILFL